MGIVRRLRWAAVLALLSAVVAASSHGGEPNTDDPSRDRPSTVVVTVRDSGFRWTDAGVGAAAMFATTLLALGVVMALRPDPSGNGKPKQALSVARKENE
jgi:hypothetical protein